MKKVALLLATAIIFTVFASCRADDNNRADTKLKEGEILLSGTVEEAYEKSLLLKGEGSDRYYIAYSDEVAVSKDGYYVVDLSADSFKGKKISVICSSEIMETYPMQTSGVRMIIIE